jgi:hypothetical protein
MLMVWYNLVKLYISLIFIFRKGGCTVQSLVNQNQNAKMAHIKVSEAANCTSFGA